MSRARGLARGPGWRAGIWAGVVALLVVTGAGVAYTFANPPRWQAESRLAIFPSERNAAAQASYYETLSAGQIVQTMADLLDARLSRSGDPSVSVHVVPNTSIVVIEATSGDAQDAEAAANTSLEDALGYVEDLRTPFGATRVSDATGGADRTGAPIPLMLTAAVLAGLIMAIAVANAAAGLARTLRRSTARDG